MYFLLYNRGHLYLMAHADQMLDYSYNWYDHYENTKKETLRAFWRDMFSTSKLWTYMYAHTLIAIISKCGP